MKGTKVLAILVLCLVACGGQAVFAGTIVCWGDNWAGMASPPSDSDYVAIAAGGHHGLALQANGSIVGWGWDGNGQATPPSGNDYVAMGGGLAHSIALKANGSIVGWGLNSYGQADPPAGSDYATIAAGGWHSLALKRDGSIVGWGGDWEGQATPPVGNNYVAIGVGGRHSLALKADGSIVAWGVSDGGSYDFGQVTNTPTDSNFVAIVAGWYHSLALKADGSIVAWGIRDGSAEDYGQVTNTPTGNGFVAIVAGHWHNLALKDDGTIVGWGRDNYNQTKQPTGKDFVAIGAGGDYSLALTKTAIGTGFIYQGRLIDADYPADDVYDFRFALYNDMTAGMQQGTTIYRDDVGVSDGYFTAGLDFGMDVFDSNALWLEIGVRPGDVNDHNSYTSLRSRQRVTPTPYAVYAESAGGDGDWAISDNYMYSIPSGNVGIGTTSPRQKLDVAGGVAISGSVGIGTANPTERLHLSDTRSVGLFIEADTDNSNEADQPSIVFSQDGGAGEGRIGFFDSTDNFSVYNTYSADLRLGTNKDSSMVVIRSTGNVGIATGSPSQKLDVAGTMQATGFKMPTGATNGYVLTSSADGTASWQPGGGGGFALPYTNGVSTPGAVFSIENTNGSIGLEGKAWRPIGNSYGVWGQSSSNTGSAAHGVYGLSRGSSIGQRYGVFGKDEDTGNFGTLGSKVNGVYGAHAVSSNSGSLGSHYYAVYGSAPSADNWAGYFVGKLLIRTDGWNAAHLNLESESYGHSRIMQGDGGLAFRNYNATGTDSAFSFRNASNSRLMNLYADGYLDVYGTIGCDVLQIFGGSDLAENFDIGEEVKPGTVVAIDPENPGKLCVSRGAYNRCVAGVVSGANEVQTGMILADIVDSEQSHAVALAGRVWVQCHASERGILCGDLLTTAERAGHGMAVMDHERAQGAVLGKAMSSLGPSETGMVLALVTLQ